MYKDYNTLKHKKSILKDINRAGKDNNWKERKLNSLDLAASYKRLKYKKAKLVEDCSSFLEFGLTVEDNLRLLRANFCKVRLCPMCSWRRSLKIFGQVSQVMDYVEENYNYRYIFLTLTVKNCYDDELKETLDHMTDSFNRLSKRVVFKKAVKGYFRSLEITYQDKDNTYHPHFHMILAVNKNYFTDDKTYLSQAKWTDLWKNCLRVDYTPIVDIRRFKENNGKEVAEVAKYTVKSNDYLIRDEKGNIEKDITDHIVKTLDNALHRKRLISFGFKFKEVNQLLNLDDTEDGDLINTDNKKLREDLTDIILRYQWNIGLKNYTLIEVNKNKCE